MRERIKRVSQTIATRSPEKLLVGSFALVIGIGTILLALPVSQHGSVGFLDALFTATSAVCVTGLTVVDTNTAYTTFGQVMIIILIQAGGVGVMAFAAIALYLLGRRLSLSVRAALNSAMFQKEIASEFASIFWRILRFVLIIETIGAILLFFGMLTQEGAARAAYSALFHSISAFCNAGFSLYSDSLVGLRDNPLVIVTITLLIVLGGIGHPVAVDFWRIIGTPKSDAAAGPKRLTLNSSIALSTSVGLILGGFVLLLAFGLTPHEHSWSTRLFAAFFQSVTARTAGFNTVNVGSLPLASLMALVFLMFIGGSPGSCAGGIKTTTFALWVARLLSLLRGEKWARIFGRHIPGEISRRASMMIGLAVLWNLFGLLFLLATERETPGVGMHDVLFEQISAFGTVGLSTGLTPKLTGAGKLWIITTMFVGRLGPLTMASWAFSRKTPGVRYPEGRIMIG
ncbi:MAG: ATPase [Deltaproteobacteria bacterium]|nr:ATPase [Deltaproteobacteria bacterium]